MSVILADLGGTNLRLARADDPGSIGQYLIRDHGSFDETLRDFCPDISALYLASAITPLSGIIEDKRFGDQSHWRIELDALQRDFSLERLVVLNDLEAAAYALPKLEDDRLSPLFEPRVPQRHFDSPPKLLIGIGTGIGHAFLFEKPGMPPFVQRTHGGHIPAMGITKDQHDLIALLRPHSTSSRELTMENIVSGHGLWTMTDLIGKEDAQRFFWEFLGLYSNMLVSLSGAYGGIYMTGGIIDDLTEEKAIHKEPFTEYFLRPMIEVVVESLSATPVQCCHDVNMAVIGLKSYAQVRKADPASQPQAELATSFA